MDDIQGNTIVDSMEVPVTEETKAKLKVGKNSVITDVGTLNIKSRLNLENDKVEEEKPQTNGLHQMNGVCESLQSNSDSATSEIQSQNVETSHVNLNQPGKKFPLFV